MAGRPLIHEDSAKVGLSWGSPRGIPEVLAVRPATFQTAATVGEPYCLGPGWHRPVMRCAVNDVYGGSCPPLPQSCTPKVRVGCGGPLPPPSSFRSSTTSTARRTCTTEFAALRRPWHDRGGFEGGDAQKDPPDSPRGPVLLKMHKY